MGPCSMILRGVFLSPYDTLSSVALRSGCTIRYNIHEVTFAHPTARHLLLRLLGPVLPDILGDEPGFIVGNAAGRNIGNALGDVSPSEAGQYVLGELYLFLVRDMGQDRHWGLILL